MPTDAILRLTFPCALALITLAMGPCQTADAAEAPPMAAEVVQDQLKHESIGESVMPDAREWQLDPATFTELKPFTAPEIAIKLPADQEE